MDKSYKFDMLDFDEWMNSDSRLFAKKYRWLDNIKRNTNNIQSYIINYLATEIKSSAKHIRIKLFKEVYGFRTDKAQTYDWYVTNGIDKYTNIYDMKPLEARSAICFLYLLFENRYTEMLNEIKRLTEISKDIEATKAENDKLKRELDKIHKAHHRAGRPPKVNGWIKNKIYRLKSEGKTNIAIADIIGINRNLVGQILKERITNNGTISNTEES